MKAFIKCEFCNAEISGERCIFAIYKRTVGGEEYHFCCENHAREFERKQRKQKSKVYTKEKK